MEASVVDTASRHALEAKGTHIGVLLLAVQADARVDTTEVTAAICRLLAVLV